MKINIFAFFWIILTIYTPAYSQTDDGENASTGNNFSVFPVFLSYNGIGNIYGVVLANDHSSLGKGVIGVTGGDAEAAGFNWNYPILEDMEIFINYAYIQKIAPLTFASRTSNPDDPFEEYSFKQNSKSSVYSLGFKYNQSDYLLYQFSFSGVQSKIIEYLTKSGQTIETPGIHLTPFSRNTVSLKISYLFDLWASEKKNSAFYVEYQNNSKSPGYAADQVLTTGTNIKVNASKSHRFGFDWFASRVIAVESPKYSREKVNEIFSIRCEEIANPEKREDCLELEAGLVNIVYGHDKYGTAKALGGAGNMRAYAQSRFRSSATNYVAISYLGRYSDKKWIPKLFLNYELGAAYEGSMSISKFDRLSYGGGGYWGLKEGGILFFIGGGDDGALATLTLQSSL